MAGPTRNRLAKPLPDRWRDCLVELGCPRRKYTAVCTLTLADGTVVEQAVVEDGWLIAIGTDVLTAKFEQRIDIDPDTVIALTLDLLV
ncbi:MAG: hypothetical protein AAGD32_08255 [Planctomycetota bacterium]